MKKVLRLVYHFDLLYQYEYRRELVNMYTYYNPILLWLFTFQDRDKRRRPRSSRPTSAVKTAKKNSFSALQNGSQQAHTSNSRNASQDIANANTSAAPVCSGVTKFTSSNSYQSELRKVEPVSKTTSDSVPVASLRKLDNEQIQPKKEHVSANKRPLTSRLSACLSQKEKEDNEDDLTHTTGPSAVTDTFSVSNNSASSKISTAMTKVIVTTRK